MRPKGWGEFQHYKNRRPPWIKLHHGLLDNPDYHRLSGDDAKYLVLLWLLASDDENGELPALADVAFRLHVTEEKANQVLSNLSAWFEQDASKTIAKPVQVAMPEVEVETEEEKEGEASASATPPTADDASDVPEGMTAMQYARGVFEHCQIPAGGNYKLQVKMADAIGFLAKEETCPLHVATGRMIERLRAAPKDTKTWFWLEDREYLKGQLVGLSTEGLE